MSYPQDILLMKVGFHGQESLGEIIARKRAEEEAFGFAYWGYGGTLCHPQKAVQPYARGLGLDERSISVLFVATPSPFVSVLDAAEEFSVDGISWTELDGPIVTASRHALVLKGLKAEEGQVDLGAYEIATGPSKGRGLDEYFRFRVDKALATLKESSSVSTSRLVKVSFSAVLVPPYAISVRHRPIP